MTHGSLFSGIGGFDLAAEWMGWENRFHCEWNPFGQRILKHYWPNATSYTDITKTDFTLHRGTIDILTGGFPCQPYSLAGKRKGKEDERHLWPEMLRAIREIQPTWVVGENVRGIINWDGGLVFHEVQTDLEAEGYEIQPFLLPASGVNAPHERYRTWFIAYSDRYDDSGKERRSPSEKKEIQKRIWQEYNTTWEFIRANEVLEIDRAINGYESDVADTKSLQYHGNDKHRRPTAAQEQGESGRGGFCHAISNTCHKGLQGCEKSGGFGCLREKQPQQSAGYVRTDWQEFPTQSPVCSGDDGLPTELDGITLSKWRNESIKAGGNAIVPQVAFQIFKAIDLYTKAS